MHMNYFFVSVIIALFIIAVALTIALERAEKKYIECSSQRLSYMDMNTQLSLKIAQQNILIAQSKADVVLMKSQLTKLKKTTDTLYKDIEKMDKPEMLSASFKAFKEQLDKLP